MAGRTLVEDGHSVSTRCSCGMWINGGRRHTCKQPQVFADAASCPVHKKRLYNRMSVETLLTCVQADWAHLSSDILSGIVLKNSLDTHKQTHLVCRQWNTSVRCNLHTMHPKVLSTEQLKLYFPALRNLHLTKVAFKENSTLCLATLHRLDTLSMQSCSFDKCESVAELGSLTGTL